MIKKWLRIDYHDNEEPCHICGTLTKTTIKVKSKYTKAGGRICDNCFLKLVKESYKEKDQ